MAMKEDKPNSAGAWGNGLTEFMQRVGVVLGSFAIIVSAFYAAFVQVPLSNINARIDKVESRLEDVSQIKQDLAVMREQNKYMSSTMTDIKKNLESKR